MSIELTKRNAIQSFQRDISVGTDPEFFAFAKGKLLPAFTFLPSQNDAGKTDWPLQKPITYWDGFQAEIALPSPPRREIAVCLMEFHVLLQKGLRQLNKIVESNSGKLTLKNVVRIPKETLNYAIDPHVELGCKPSFNAYGIKGVDVVNPRELRYRFAGGHMHFGGIFKGKKAIKTVKLLDSILGIWAVGAAENFDNPIRRQYYGLPGEYRTPKHGLEYRVLSNFWLSSPVISQATWEIARQTVYLSYKSTQYLWSAMENEVIDIIRRCDVKSARQVLKRNENFFKWMFCAKGWDDQTIQRLFDIGMYGIEKEQNHPEEIAKNWKIESENSKVINAYVRESWNSWTRHCEAR